MAAKAREMSVRNASELSVVGSFGKKSRRGSTADTADGDRKDKPPGEKNKKMGLDQLTEGVDFVYLDHAKTDWLFLWRPRGVGCKTCGCKDTDEDDLWPFLPGTRWHYSPENLAM